MVGQVGTGKNNSKKSGGVMFTFLNPGKYEILKTDDVEEKERKDKIISERADKLVKFNEKAFKLITDKTTYGQIAELTNAEKKFYDYYTKGIIDCNLDQILFSVPANKPNSFSSVIYSLNYMINYAEKQINPNSVQSAPQL